MMLKDNIKRCAVSYNQKGPRIATPFSNTLYIGHQKLPATHVEAWSASLRYRLFKITSLAQSVWPLQSDSESFQWLSKFLCLPRHVILQYLNSLQLSWTLF